MILSHRYRFIFIKTVKTAGTSIEVHLSRHCGEKDVVTPVMPPVEPHIARNYRGFWNPLPEILDVGGRNLPVVLRQLSKRRKFFNHIPARLIRHRIPKRTWDEYFKFCVERNPWDKTLSHYHMINDRAGGSLPLEDYFENGRFCVNYRRDTNAAGELMLDRVVKYESLIEELGDIFDDLGIPFEGTLGVRAKSDHRKERTPYREVLTDEQRQKIEDAFADEIRMHGYSF